MSASIATARDAVVTLLNAAVAAHAMPIEGWTAEKRIVPPIEATALGETLHVLVLPATGKVSRISRGKIQQISTISVGVIQVIRLAGGAPDQDTCDGLMGLAEKIADYMSQSAVGDVRLTEYDPVRIREGIFFAQIDADYFTLRDVP